MKDRFHRISRFTGLTWILAVFVELILSRSRILFLGDWFAGDTIFTFNPPAKIDKLASFRTEGTERIVFPLDWLTAGWALHES